MFIRRRIARGIAGENRGGHGPTWIMIILSLAILIVIYLANADKVNQGWQSVRGGFRNVQVVATAVAPKVEAAAQRVEVFVDDADFKASIGQFQDQITAWQAQSQEQIATLQAMVNAITKKVTDGTDSMQTTQEAEVTATPTPEAPSTPEETPTAPEAPATDSLEVIHRTAVGLWVEWYSTQERDWTGPLLPEETALSKWVAEIGRRVAGLGYTPENTPEYQFAISVFNVAQQLKWPPRWDDAKRYARRAVETGILGTTDPDPLVMVERLQAVVEACDKVAQDFGVDCKLHQQCLTQGEVYACIANAAGHGANKEVASTSTACDPDTIQAFAKEIGLSDLDAACELWLARQRREKGDIPSWVSTKVRGEIWNEILIATKFEVTPSEEMVDKVLPFIKSKEPTAGEIEQAVREWLNSNATTKNTPADLPVTTTCDPTTIQAFAKEVGLSDLDAACELWLARQRREKGDIPSWVSTKVRGEIWNEILIATKFEVTPSEEMVDKVLPFIKSKEPTAGEIEQAVREWLNSK